MSRENVEIVRGAFEAYARGDREGLMQLFHPDLVWHSALNQATYRGAKAVCDLILDEIPQMLEGFATESFDIRDLGGDQVFVTVRYRGKAAHAGIELSHEFGHVFRVQDGQIVESHGYNSAAEALEAVGLRE